MHPDTYSSSRSLASLGQQFSRGRFSSSSQSSYKHRGSGLFSSTSHWDSSYISPSTWLSSLSSFAGQLGMVTDEIQKEDFTKIQQQRKEEKEQIMGLNSQFAMFISQVRQLEQANKKHEAQWNVLQEKNKYISNIENVYQVYYKSLKQMISNADQERNALDHELKATLEMVETCKQTYEKEIGKRTEKENEFVLIKQSADESEIINIELEAMCSTLSEEIQYLQKVYEQEIKELKSQIQDISVVVEIDSSRTFNVSSILAEVRHQYALAIENVNKEYKITRRTQIDEIKKANIKFQEELGKINRQIAETTTIVSKLNYDIRSIEQQIATFKAEIVKAEQAGKDEVDESNKKILDLKSNRDRMLKEMQTMEYEYKELAKLRMALNLAIFTYKNLLESEEKRPVVSASIVRYEQGNQEVTSAHQFSSSSSFGNSYYQWKDDEIKFSSPISKSRLLIEKVSSPEDESPLQQMEM